MPKTYRAGLVGCGRMGATIDDEVKDRPNSHLYLPYSHAAALVACARTELVAVCDPVVEKARAAQERYGAARHYTDYQEMIRREGLDILCIATRPSPHAEVTLFAARNGVRGIYCEKPLCNSMRQADAMLEAGIEFGADEVVSSKETHEFLCKQEDFANTRDGLEAKLGAPQSASVVWQPLNSVAVNDEKGAQLLKLLDVLDDHDDVQNVYANYEVSDALMEKLSAA